MNTVKLTPENVFQYIGNEIIFKTRNRQITTRLIGASETGKTIQIDHPDLQNNLQLVTRNVYVIIG